MWKCHQYLYNKQNIKWPLGDPNSSSRGESISQHSKIKFLSPRGHVISFSLSYKHLTNKNEQYRAKSSWFLFELGTTLS